MRAAFVGVLGLPLSVVALAFSCGHSSLPATVSDAGTDGGTTAGPYARSACGRCLRGACSLEVSSCAGDPDCAAYLTCLDRCGTGDGGNIDPACAAGCPRGSSSSGAAAESALSECWTNGPGALCAPCGGNDASAATNPILRQRCPTSSGADACATCQEDHCCQTEAACTSECMGYVGCRVDGGSPTVCRATYPGGLLQAEAWQSCRFVFCAAKSQCNGGFPPCERCAVTLCSEEYVAFRTHLQGALYRECISYCGSDDCSAACLKSYPGARPLIDAFDACIFDKCSGCPGA